MADRHEGDRRASDPFAPHLAFVERAMGAARDVRPRRASIEPARPIDTRADRLVDLDALEALASWQGLRRPPREMAEDEYPSDLEEAMEEREPQFILRNIPRVERFADPDERLGYDRSSVQYGLNVDGATEARTLRHEPPQLLDEMNLDVVRAQIRWRHWVAHEARWDRHFSREIRDETQGPMWRRPMEEASPEERQVQPDEPADAEAAS